MSVEHYIISLNYFLQKYYNSYDPVYYRRSYDFLHSAVKVEPKVIGNKVAASEYIDTDSMDNYYEATGEEVAPWANQGTHGGTIQGNNTPHVWDDTMRETVDDDELLRLALEYLQIKGTHRNMGVFFMLQWGYFFTHFFSCFQAVRNGNKFSDNSSPASIHHKQPTSTYKRHIPKSTTIPIFDIRK